MNEFDFVFWAIFILGCIVLGVVGAVLSFPWWVSFITGGAWGFVLISFWQGWRN